MKILYLHVGVLVRVFSIHQNFKKILEPTYLRITASWFTQQLCLIILLDHVNVMRKIMILNLQKKKI